MGSSNRWLFALIALPLAAPATSLAQSLDISAPYGNAAGCEFAKAGLRVNEEMLLLKPDRVESYATGCDFVEVLTAKDGSKVVTGICGYEGDDGIGTQSFVVSRSRTDSAGLVIYNSDGSVFGEVAPCP
jgi:hypothetical protein